MREGAIPALQGGLNTAQHEPDPRLTLLPQAAANYRTVLGLPEEPYPEDGSVHVVDEIMMQVGPCPCSSSHSLAPSCLQ